MTRHELASLKNVANAIPSRPDLAAIELTRIISAAEEEFDKEDAWHDLAEDQMPVLSSMAA